MGKTLLNVRSIWSAAAVALVASSCLFWGCYSRTGYVVQRVQPVVATQPQRVVYTQPAPIVVRQPTPVVYVRQPTVYVRQPTVYVRQPAPVRTPVRIRLAPVLVSGVNSWPQRHCVPGASRPCEGATYCGYGGVQYCNNDGMSWTQCMEGY